MKYEDNFENEIPFSKTEVINEFIKSLTLKAEELLESANKSFETSAQMDGKMQSRYDTQKEDHAADGNMKLALAINTKEKIEAFKSIESNVESIGINSLFQLEDLVNKTKEWFFISEMSGAHSITLNGERIIGLNPESPLGAHALGKSVSEVIRYEIHGEQQKFRVLNII